MKRTNKLFYALVLWSITMLKYHSAVSQLNTAGTYVWNATDSPKVFNGKLQLSFVNSPTGFPNYGTVLAGGGYTSSQDGASFQIYFPYNVQYGGNAPRVRLGLYNNQGWSDWSTFFTSANANLPTVTWTAKDLIAYGNVLIGKTSQSNSSYRLDVNGNIRANKVVVNTTGADYVFDSAYRLTELDSLDIYIRANHHLPGISSAKEMSENGIDVGDLEIRLLQKVEEMTLYILEANQRELCRLKQMQDMQKQIEGLKKELKALKSEPL